MSQTSRFDAILAADWQDNQSAASGNSRNCTFK